MWFLEQRIGRNVTSIGQGLGEGEGSSCLMGTEFQFCKMERALKMVVIAQHRECTQGHGTGRLGIIDDKKNFNPKNNNF